MASPRACSKCSRLLRRQLRHDRAIHIFDTSSRAFSSQYRLLQQAPQSRDPPQHLPSVPPTTTSRITSNIAAQPGNSSSNTPSTSSSQNGPSTAEMQRAISSSLSTSKPTTSLPQTLASRLRATATKATDPYMVYGISQSLFRTCSLQANYTIPESQRQGILTGQGPLKTAAGEDLGVPDTGAVDAERKAQSWWFKDLNLAPTFSTWSQVTYLHMYILVVRLRAVQDRDSVAKYQHYLLDHFSHAAEEKMMILHGMSARGIRNRYLKDLFLQWRGLLTAYDEGLVKGDAVLAGVVWRNLWKGEKSVDWERVAVVVGFVRRAIQELGKVADGSIQEVVADGGVVFEEARTGLSEQVRRQSQGITEVPDQ